GTFPDVLKEATRLILFCESNVDRCILVGAVNRKPQSGPPAGPAGFFVMNVAIKIGCIHQINPN
ncbi:MAG: hypothetical protein PVI58_18560, partial [Desulfobacterales bacterium]